MGDAGCGLSQPRPEIVLAEARPDEILGARGDAERCQAPRVTEVAEIPGYLQGLNPLSIEAVTRRLASLLNQPVDLNSLRSASNEWEAQVTEAVGNDEDLRATVRKLEEQYDNELIGAPSHDEEEETEDQEQADEEE